MTPAEKRIAIAECCPFVERTGKGEWVWRVPDGRRIYFDPINDLNAMHSAEKTLTENQWYDYTAHLTHDIVGPYSYVRATAAQRADAFLMVNGKI